MIEKVILDYLQAQLNPVPVGLQEPSNQNPTPENFVVIQRTGGGEDNKIKSATFAIQSYGATLLDACQLNESVKSAMENIIELNSISRCKLQSDYEYTKLSTKHPRYQAVFDIVHY
jgi:hypothetical protein